MKMAMQVKTRCVDLAFQINHVEFILLTQFIKPIAQHKSLVLENIVWWYMYLALSGKAASTLPACVDFKFDKHYKNYTKW